MKLGSLTSIVLLFLARTVLSEELRFSNESAWLLSFGDKWTVSWFPHPSVSPHVRESSVKFVNGRFELDLKEGPPESLMLFHNNIYVCHLKKGEKEGWVVPKLSNVTFDLGGLEEMPYGDFITFDAKDPISAFHLELQSGNKIERLIDQGLILEFYTVGTKVSDTKVSDTKVSDTKVSDTVVGDTVVSATKGVVLVADSNHGVVKLEGNIKGKWSMTIDWSP